MLFNTPGMRSVGGTSREVLVKTPMGTEWCERGKSVMPAGEQMRDSQTTEEQL